MTWTILFLACTATAPTTCYPGTASVTARTPAECREYGIEGLAAFEAYNPRLTVRAWTCKGPAGLKGALYE